MGKVLWTLSRVCLAGPDGPRLEALTASIEPGVTAVLGPSGAGKTSLLNLLVRYEKPDSGLVAESIETDGRPLPLYWVPQGAGLWPHLTAWEHLRAVAPDTAEGELAALLDAMAMAAKRCAHPDELSMGERSRLAVARALACRAAVLVMDEPLAHVDRARAPEFWTVIRRHVGRSGASLVFATHASETVLSEAERVICLKGGRLIYQGDVQQLYHCPSSREQAECLGEVNWLSPEQARVWLAPDGGSRACYRPEHLEVQPSANGPLVVHSYRFRGPAAESELRHEQTGRVRRFFHRACRLPLRGGERVRLKALLLMAALLCLSACRDEASLSVRAVNYWPMPAHGTGIPAPRAVAIGRDDEVVVLDTAGRVLVFDANGNLLRQWSMPDYEAGTAESVRVLADGRIAVSDTHYSRIVFFTWEGRYLGALGGHGREPGRFIYPVGIAQDDNGYLYVCEYGGNDRVQKFTARGEFVASFGSFGTGQGQFQRPSGMAWHDGRLYVADAINNRVLIYGAQGRYLGVLGGGLLALEYPYDIAPGPGGSLYVVEYGAGRVTVVDAAGQVLGRYGTTGRGEGQLYRPWGIAVDSRGRVRVADTQNRRIVELRL